MKKILAAFFLLFTSLISFSQSNKIVGSWVLRDSAEVIQFFANSDGTIEERTGMQTEDIWKKKPRMGTYKFTEKGKFLITWSDKKIETREVKFENSFKVAKIKFLDRKNNSKKELLFLKIVDEEVITN